MKINLDQCYICWSPRILSALFDAGFKLWIDPKGRQENPFLDIKKRYDKNGILQTPKTGYIFDKTPELMYVVGMYSKQKD